MKTNVLVAIVRDRDWDVVPDDADPVSRAVALDQMRGVMSPRPFLFFIFPGENLFQAKNEFLSVGDGPMDYSNGITPVLPFMLSGPR